MSAEENGGERHGREMGQIRALLDQIEREHDAARKKLHSLGNKAMIAEHETGERLARLDAQSEALGKSLDDVEADIGRLERRADKFSLSGQQKLHEVEKDLAGIKARLMTWAGIASAVVGLILWAIRTGVQSLAE